MSHAITRAMDAKSLIQLVPTGTGEVPAYVNHGCCNGEFRTNLMFTLEPFSFPTLGIHVAVLMTDPCPVCHLVAWHEFRSNV